MFGTGQSSSPSTESAGYETWLKDNFPEIVSAPFAERHRRLWEWFEALSPELTPPPRIEVWPRGGAKSSTGELGIAFIASKLSRKFALYVCETQDQADRHVQAVSALLGSLGYGAAINTEGHSKGWRRQQLRVSNGFNLEGIGLDVAVRGIKLDQYRPDLIIFDDIDNREDNPKRTKKKESAVTQSILPAGAANHCAILFLQNLIIDDGIVSRIVEGRAEYLRNSDIQGPIKAVDDLKVEDAILPNGRTYKKIVSGLATWAGQSIEICQRQILEWGWTAFKRESQQEVAGADGYFFDHTAFKVVATIDDVPGNHRWRYCRAWDLAATEGGGDYTVGVLMAASISNGPGQEIVVVLDVQRHQFEPAKVRKLIDATAKKDKEKYGVVKIHFPQDPSQAGKDQAEQYSDRLRSGGHAIKAESVRGPKATRAGRWAEQVNDGNAYLLQTEWNWAFIEEHRKFREDEQHDFDDQVDAAADAAVELTGRKAGAPAGKPSTPKVQKQHASPFV